MSPTRKPAATLAATLLLVSGMAGAQAPSAAAPPPAAAAAPLIQLPPTRPREDFVPNTMAPAISPEARANFIANLMAVNPFSLRDMIAMMATRYPVKAGLSFDEVVESMKLKANELNFKLVGHNPLWKDVAAITGKPTPRIEFFTFCDAMVAREILDYSLEFAVFLPCRIAVVEDAHKQLWVMTLDWDVRWLDNSKNPNRISDALRTKAIQVREIIDRIMRAGASGDF
jgi:uncharacterized protein (DUF302 family)